MRTTPQVALVENTAHYVRLKEETAHQVLQLKKTAHPAQVSSLSATDRKDTAHTTDRMLPHQGQR